MIRISAPLQSSTWYFDCPSSTSLKGTNQIHDVDDLSISITSQPLAQPCQFMSNLQKLDKFKNDGGVVVWLDYTKYGKLTNGDLNDSLDLMKACMARCPEKVVGFIICPFLVSEKASVQGSLRGEIRTEFNKPHPHSFPTQGLKKIL